MPHPPRPSLSAQARRRGFLRRLVRTLQALALPAGTLAARSAGAGGGVQERVAKAERGPSGAAASAIDLRVNQLSTPLGLDDPAPRLSWRLRHPARGAAQSAWRITVADTREALLAGAPLRWDSGRVASAESLDVPYRGPAPAPGQRLWWQVALWDARGRALAPSAPSWWEAGLLREAAWHGAQWLDAEDDATRALRAVGLHWFWGAQPLHHAPRRFRLRLQLAAAPRRATLYLSAKDTLQGVWLDGRPLLLPARWLPWGRLSTLDLTDALRVGSAQVLALQVQLRTDQPRPVYGGAVAALLRLEDAAGRITWRSGAGGWRTSVDAAPEHWREPGFDDAHWPAAQPAAIDPGCEPWPPGPARLLRHAFTLARPVLRARLYVTALGACEPRLNGQRVGASAIAPESTDFRVRVLYQVHDVTALLVPGPNVLGAIVGDGWFASAYGYLNLRYAFGPAPRRLRALLVVEHDDGSVQRIATGPGWRSAPSAVQASDIFDGETYDARLEQPDWDIAPFDDRAWHDAVAAPAPHAALLAQAAPPLRALQTLTPVALSEPVPGQFVFDFGQNFAGWARLRVHGPRGATVSLRFAELLAANGEVDTSNLRRARARDDYTLRGDPAGEVHEPRFTYHGFRYVQMSGHPGRPDAASLQGVVVHSDLELTGRFRCGDAVIERFWHNVLWSQRSNFFGIPTDCPQRDERMGWVGDAQVFWDAAAFNMDVAAFTRRFMDDIRAGQTDDGELPDTAPFPTRGGGSPGWADGGVILPWVAWRRYGSRAVIDDNWDAMRAWNERVLRLNADHVWRNGRGLDYGDWLAPDARQPGDETTPKTLIATAFWAHVTTLLAEMAQATGRAAEARLLQVRAQRIGAAFRREFVRADGSVGNRSQTSQVLALRFGLVPAALQPAAAAVLAADIRARGGALATGFLGTPYLLDVLADHGHAELALALLRRRAQPSWGYMVERGATTVWERWNSDTSGTAMNSFNHYALGAVVGFLYRRVAGIDEAEPGFRRLRLRPLVDRALGHAGADYRSAMGPIACHWRFRPDGALEVEVEVPPNARAELTLPVPRAARLREGDRAVERHPDVVLRSRDAQRAVLDLGAGRYRFIAAGDIG